MIFILKIFLISILLYHNLCDEINSMQLSKNEKKNVWKTLLNGRDDLPRIKKLYNENDKVNNNFEINQISIESNLPESSEIINVNLENDKNLDEITSILTTSDELNNTVHENNKNIKKKIVNVFDSIENYSNATNLFNNNNNLDNIYEESVASLRDVDKYFWLMLKNNNLMVRTKKNGAKILEDNSKYQEILLNSPNSGQKSLVIVFDCTGSMIDDLKEMIEAAELITNEFINSENNPIFNYIFVPFRDPYIGPKLVTQDVNKFFEEMRQLYLFGGGDCPEPSIGAINLALESALPKSHIFIFTDATGKDFGLDRDTIKLIQKHQATLTFLLTGHCKSKDSDGYRVYEKLASLSNGAVYNLQKNNIREVLIGIRSNIQQNVIPLQYLHSKEPGQHNFDVPVDSNLKTFTVSVAGQSPTINVLNPKLEKFENVEEVLNLSELKILNVVNPEPGNWNVKTESDSEHSVKFTGHSDLNFRYGFTTTDNSDSIQDTNIYPILLQNNILLIAPSENDLINNLTSVEFKIIPNDIEILSDTPKDIKLPLNKLEDDSVYGTNLFGTKKFQPPRSMFKIYLNGFDSNGNPLKHLLSTAIKAVKGESPFIVNFDNYIQVEEGDNTILECKVHTFSPVTIVWLRNNKQMISESETFNNFVVSYLKLDNMTTIDSGPYVCITENVNGMDTKEIQVVVREKEIPLSVLMIPDYLNGINEGDMNYQLSCVGNQQQNLKFKWYFNNEPIQNDKFEIDNQNLVFKYVNRNMTGNYTCEASDGKMEAIDSAFIEIKYGPEILRPFKEDIYINYGENFEFDCESIGNPTPEIIWTKPKKFIGNFKNGIFENFNPTNEGIYKCEAFNGIESSQEKIFNVKGKASSSPVIEKPFNELILDVNETLNLVCKCDLCEPILNNSWTREISSKFEFLPTTDESIDQNYHKFFNSNISLDKITIYDEGLYICRLDNEYGFDNWTVQIKVIEPPTDINIISNSMEIIDSTTFEGVELKTYKFECTVEGGNPKPEFKWFKYNQFNEKNELINNSRNNENNILEFPNIESMHNGKYACIASNIKGSISKDFLINVLVPPKLKSTEETVIIIEDGREVLLECNVNGNPYPKISWKYNNQSLQLNENRYQIYNEFLRFTAELKHSGVYECEAINKIGSIKKNIILIVFAAPKIFPPEKEIITTKIGDNIYLPCNFTGYPMPDIKWKFNHNESHFIDILKENQHQKYENNELAIFNINRSMEGIYMCEIENEHGIARKSYLLNVNFPPKIISNFQSSYKLKPNDKLNVFCDAEGKPTPEISWKKSTSIISNFNATLSLTNTNKTISDNYTCIATNIVGTDTKTIEINALVKPKFIRRSIENSIPNITAEYGHDAKLYCPIEYADSFVWFKGNTKLNRLEFDNEPFLHLQNVTYENSGNYTCTGINEVGVKNYTQLLLVNSPPNIQTMTSKENIIETDILDITVNKGDNRTLKCLPNGYPKPKVQWRKDKTYISNSLELNLIDINIAHSGEYICEAQNQYGTDEIIFNVRVLVPPSSEQPKKNWIELNKGDDLILQCEIYGNPWPNFHWLKDGVNLTGEFQEALIIHYSGVENNGIYKCVAKNELGEHEIEFIVNVMAPPTFNSDRMKNEIIFTKNDTIELECSVEGNPLPILTWVFNNQILISTSRVSNLNLKDETNENQIDYIFIDRFGNTFTYYNPNEIFGSQLWENQKNGLYGKVIRTGYKTNLTLIIDDEKLKKNGVYTCYAINAIGSNKYDTKIEIYYKPNITNHNSDDDKFELVTVLKGLPLVLACPSIGHPTPEITWFKDNFIITSDFNQFSLSHDNSSLTIYNTHESDSGNWTCIVKNLLGTDQKLFKIEILSAPQLQIENSIDNFDEIQPTNIKLLNGQKTTLNCPVIGNPMPQIFWLKDDKNINISNYESINYHIIFPDNPTELIINDLQESGLYSCYANNSLGFILKKFTVEILKYPKIDINEPDELNVTELDPVKIHCLVDGNPQPEIFWYKDGSIINFREDKTLYLDSDGEILKIPTVQLEHTGKYACVARNELGDEVKYISLNVKASAIWSPWDSWAQCNVTCGSGIKYRKRRCIRFNGESALNAHSCSGNDFESKLCEMQPCPIDGGWSNWSEWEECPTLCWNELENKPIRKRYRFCNNPIPRYGGRICYGENIEENECNLNICPIDGGWSAWSSWSSCSVSCGIGVKERSRICNNPKPLNGGKYCKGLDKSVQSCTLGSCSIDGGWSEWSSWSECSETCGNGFRKRSRQCNKPKPEYGGKMCDGSNIEVAKCKKRQCNNSHLVKKINFPIQQKKPKYAANTIFDSPSYYTSSSFTEEYDEMNEENDNEYAFALGDTQIFPKENDKDEILKDNENENVTDSVGGKLKVVLEVKSFRPLDKDLKEVSFYPGKAPFVIQRINPCSFGQKLGDNNECIELDLCKIENSCKKNQVCINQEKGIACSCYNGYNMNYITGDCEDINECLDNNNHNCTHICNNTPGSYFCSCPNGFEFKSNNITCEKISPLLENIDNEFMSDYANTTLKHSYSFNSPPEITSDGCPEGFEENDGKCEDVNECDIFESDCHENYSCLNTFGSYKCIETICPPEYKRTNIIGQCVLMCNESQSCSNNAKIAEIISHTLLSVNEIPKKEPFLKIVNYGINRRALPYTTFIIDQTKSDGRLFELETFGMEKGIAYLYAKEKLKHQKLYRLIIEAESFNENNFELNYITKFIIFLYLI